MVSNENLAFTVNIAIVDTNSSRTTYFYRSGEVALSPCGMPSIGTRYIIHPLRRPIRVEPLFEVCWLQHVEAFPAHCSFTTSPLPVR